MPASGTQLSVRLPPRLDAAHQPFVVPDIVDRYMFDAAVVPESERPLFPAKAAGQFRSVSPIHKPSEERGAFFLCHTFECHRIRLIDEETSAACFRMSAHHGMNIPRLPPLII